MTTEEAIKALKLINLDRVHPFLSWEEMMEVRDMAISALRTQQAADDAIEGLCCDCVHGGPCCDYSENEGCEHHRADGSCWILHRPAKLDRSRWKGCKFCAREIYIKTTQYLRSAIAPATYVGELRDRLIDLTGEVFLETPKKYCHICGRPLTEDAWAELERRIGGNDGTTD